MFKKAVTALFEVSFGISWKDRQAVKRLGLSPNQDVNLEPPE
jgi:hypothetical protein